MIFIYYSGLGSKFIRKEDKEEKEDKVEKEKEDWIDGDYCIHTSDGKKYNIDKLLRLLAGNTKNVATCAVLDMLWGTESLSNTDLEPKAVFG